jgi:hypothetical protein
MDRAEQTEAEITRRLTAALQPGSPNGISAGNLRKWVVGHLQRYDDELANFPDEVGKPHWNLWMIDKRAEDALFAVFVFRSSGVQFFCGTGEAFAVKRFSESEFPDDVEQLPAEMARLFKVPEGSLHLSWEDAEAWLGRGW